MNKREFDRRISEITNTVVGGYEHRDSFLCIEIGKNVNPHARTVFEKVFYPERPKRERYDSPGDAWLGTMSTTAKCNQLRLEFLYRFWDYCIERKLYLNW